ncbi:MAG: uracil-DNA glycosylase, partial [Archangium sp.]|nr:uracil-DNA glycosylase [Archangium sp.]
PGSLRNIFAGLNADLGVAVPKHGDLSPWAARGVLLLNTVLTVREGDAGSHQGHGWEDFTTAVLRHVGAQPGPIVFLCFGKPAQRLVAELIDARTHVVLNAPHPSPLNGRKFVETVKAERLFTKANEVLSAAGRQPVDWSLG